MQNRACRTTKIKIGQLLCRSGRCGVDSRQRGCCRRCWLAKSPKPQFFWGIPAPVAKEISMGPSQPQVRAIARVMSGVPQHPESSQCAGPYLRTKQYASSQANTFQHLRYSRLCQKRRRQCRRHSWVSSDVQQRIGTLTSSTSAED